MLIKFFIIACILSLSFAQQASETYVLVHGATVGSWSWFKVKERLEKKGHNVITFDLPALGVNKTNLFSVQLQDHVNAVLTVLDSLPAPAILVGHCYGGVLVSLASDLRPNKVKEAVYIAALMLQNGESALSALQRDTQSLALANAVTLYNNLGAPTAFGIRHEALEEVLCEDCGEEDLELIEALSQLQPASTFNTPITLGTEFALVSKTYISTLQDNAYSPNFQKSMYSKYPDAKIYKINTGHMAPLIKQNKIVEILTNL